MRKIILLFIFCFSPGALLAQEPKLMLPVGHTLWVFSGAFSPDGKRVVTASRDNSAKIWDTETGMLLANLTAHPFDVYTAVYSPDGTKIVTASEDKTAKIWDAESGAMLYSLDGHTANVYMAVFSADGRKIATASKDGTARIWNANTGKLIYELKGHDGPLKYATFSPDNKQVVTASLDKTAKIWSGLTGKLLYTLRGHNAAVNTTEYNPAGTRVLTASDDHTAKIWEAATGKLLFTFAGHAGRVCSARFSADGKKIVTASADRTAILWDASTGKMLAQLSGHTASVNIAIFSPDGKRITTASNDHTVKQWTVNGKLLITLKQHADNVNTAIYSRDGKRLLTTSNDNTAKIWDAATGKPLVTVTNHTPNIISASITADGAKIAAVFQDSTVKIWDVASGRLSANLNGSAGKANSAAFSDDGKKLVTASGDGSTEVWDAVSGKLLINIKGNAEALSAGFSGDGSKIYTVSADSSVTVWDAVKGKAKLKLPHYKAALSSARFNNAATQLLIIAADSTALIWDLKSNFIVKLAGHSGRINTAVFNQAGDKIVTAADDHTAIIWSANGQLLKTLKGHQANVSTASFNNEGDKVVTSSFDNSVKLWSVETGEEVLTLTGHTSNVWSAYFSADDKKIITASRDKTAKVWDAGNGKLLSTLNGHFGRIAANFSKDVKRILTYSLDNRLKLWDAETNKLLYTFFAVDSADYLVVDSYNRYDGTEGARKLLYFTCGTEVIGLDQVKDQLWVPNLVERILKGENINAPKLSDLNICGLTPLVEDKVQKGGYGFKITPRRGGLGETVLYVNDIEVKRYQPAQLSKTRSCYELHVAASELQAYFATGQSNPVTIRSYTAKNDISSRGAVILNKPGSSPAVKTTPNLYAVMIGVSDYKGPELQLKYAAKDATDLSKAFAFSARKLLNTDGREHVFVYNLTTNKNRYLLPEKRAIQQTLAMIGKKAAANDILLIFFAGHGVTHGEKKQFYFLSADASGASAMDAPALVGISTAELTDWIQPSKMKAQKRILILDACNSGQAINDLVQFGGKQQNYVAARGDDRAGQIKAIDKLNERSGFFILAASASNQSAYEMGRYSQGLLTYALLKAMKDHPDILEDKKYLNISRWFGSAEKTVTEIVNATGNRQQPQIVSSGNFNIGMVDDEVIQNIHLANEKPMFSRSDFRNADQKIDNLRLRGMVDSEMTDLSGGVNDAVSYRSDYEGADAYSLTGDYKVMDNVIKASVILIKGGTEIKYQYEVSGSAAHLKQLAASIAAQAVEWLDKNK